MKLTKFTIYIFYHSILVQVLVLAIPPDSRERLYKQESFKSEDYDAFQMKKKENEKLKEQDPQFYAEIQAGDMADYFGVNKHKFVPPLYKEFDRRRLLKPTRRFVLQYPYIESQDKPATKSDNDNNAAEISLDKAIEQIKLKNAEEEERLVPRQAPQELVLEIAKQSAKLDALKPVSHTAELLAKENLRTGDYWNDVYVEEVKNPESILRSHDKRVRVDVADENLHPKLNVVRVRVMPGSKLHDLVSQAKRISPKLLYVINKRENK